VLSFFSASLRAKAKQSHGIKEHQIATSLAALAPRNDTKKTTSLRAKPKAASEAWREAISWFLKNNGIAPVQ
jgi:hypothetical protein